MANLALLRAWYKQWYGTDVPATSPGAMLGIMMGCGGAMDSTLAGLKSATDFDKAFIEQMIPHHQMALMMSQMILMGGQMAELRTLVQLIITGQSTQITQMRSGMEVCPNSSLGRRSVGTYAPGKEAERSDQRAWFIALDFTALASQDPLCLLIPWSPARVSPPLQAREITIGYHSRRSETM
ncbi:MAG: DUF305 domain-containing protein [Chloroflexota bacterium]|nr:DUF305 domain-containing protein [Chloroflexota bacterium]